MSAFDDIWNQIKDHPRERVKLWLGRVFCTRSTHRWCAFVRQHPLLWSQVGHFPKLLTRIYRPYGFRPMGVGQRVQTMVDHYTLTQRLGLNGLVQQCANQAQALSTVPTKTNANASLQLIAIHDGHREGELSLQLHWGDRFLYSLTFVLAHAQTHNRAADAGAVDLIVTRLQGNRDADAKELIRFATKAFHGQRPSVLLVQAARRFAFELGCQHVRLVSNRQRVALNPVRRMKIKVDLEPLWTDVGAVPDAGGFYGVSPAVEIPHDFSAVSSNKRAEAKRKAALLEAMLDGLSQHLQARPSPIDGDCA